MVDLHEVDDGLSIDNMLDKNGPSGPFFILINTFMLLKEIFNRAPQILSPHMDKFASIAQRVYDAWDENVDEYAGGGICHLIAEEICDYLNDLEIECATVSQQIDEQHVYVVAKLPEGVYRIDIPPSTYEVGGGYSWEKIPDVKFDRDDVIIDQIDSDPDNFEEYIDY